MKRTVSIADAKDQLPRLVHEVEEGRIVEITRRGNPVAVLLSTDAYRRLLPGRGAVWRDFARLHAALGLDELGVDPDDWLAGVRGPPSLSTTSPAVAGL
ncbi:MAG: type II toxin-antitoxin system Phd/YefM family antitoxin [Alphaproteobacteria bacterium]|nr:type II toxin-antitoxin system Phd/YefM family antitoxin [Alphaproteobacteria bacterium]